MSASPRDQPSPHQLGSAHSPPSQNPEEFISPSNDNIQDPQPPSQTSDDQPPHPPFEPVFTLLTNTTTNTTTHPRVHYIFSDDDPSILSTADDPNRRSVLIDLVPSQPSASASPAPAWSVSWAASLSPDFAVTSSRLTEQQHDGSGAAGDAMLRLEGVEREPVELKQLPPRRSEDSDDEDGGVGVEPEDQDALVEDFKRRMGVLQKVIDEASKRESTLAGQFEQEEDDDDDNEEAVTSGPRGDDDRQSR